MKVALLSFIVLFLINICSFTMVSTVQAKPVCDMHTLIQQNEYKKAQACLEQQNADPNKLDSNSISPLNLLFKFDHVKTSLMHQSIYDLAESLIINGADVNHTVSKNLTPFQIVLTEGNSSTKTREMIALMLRHGADPEAVTLASSYITEPKNLITPLIWAIRAHENSLLDELITKGVDLEYIPAPNSLSPIETSLTYQNDYAFKLLLRHGVRIPPEKAEKYLKLASHQLGNFNTTYLQTILAYDWPIKWSSQAAAEKVAYNLYQHQEIPPNLFKQAIKNWKIELADIFLVYAIQEDEGQDNPLFSVLLEMGLDATIQFDEKKYTLLQLLAIPRLCNLGKVKLLLEYGADISAKDDDGNTAIDQIRIEMQKIDNFIIQYQQKADKEQNRYSEKGDVNEIMAMAFGESPKFSPFKKSQVDKKKLSKMSKILLR